MKNFFKIFVVVLVAAAFASCSSTKQTAPVMAIGGNNIVTTVKADLDYKGAKKINGAATTHRVLWIFSHTANGNKQLKSNNKYKGLNKTESVALYRAKTAGDVDVVLEPEFETEVKSYFFGIYKKTDVKMKGWGVNIKGFSDGTPMQNQVENFGGNILF